jgi:lysophospholipase L1-like esterase
MMSTKQIRAVAAALLSGTWFLLFPLSGTEASGEQSVDGGHYLAGVNRELERKWPENRTVRFVFHGHSVPAGYFRTPEIRRFDSYPMLFYRSICERFPTGMVDVSITAIGGEASPAGAARFRSDVLSLKPDVVFIDYSLNDRGPGLEKSREAWASMIRDCRDHGIKVILMTPTPDSRENILDSDSPLARHAAQVLELGREFGVPVVDSFNTFRDRVEAGHDVEDFLSQINHPNRRGHEIVAELILNLFNN